MAVKNGGELHALPKDCIIHALSLTTPKDACRLSLVDSTFCSAAKSDDVWERFLPSDYRDLISRSSDGSDSLLTRFKSKKELYLYLCEHPILIDSGLKSFSLEKSSGKKCYMLSARDLFIVRGDTAHYWQWISLPEFRFSEVVELLEVYWFDIEGKISMKMLSLGTNYAAYLVFTCKSTMHGFESNAVETRVRISRHKAGRHRVCLVPGGFERRRYHVVRPRRLPRASVRRDISLPRKRNDGWMEVELGELFVKGGEEGDLEMTLMEVKGSYPKGGIIILGIEIRPKECW